jgi:hypothetical protein
MRNRPYTFAYVVLLMLGTAGLGVDQDGGQQPSAREQLQHIHTPQSIDQKLASLTKDLELTPKQQRQVRPLLQEHHDNIQALLDKYPTASRQDLAPQIHAISDETHRQIHALLTDHQKELEKAMVQRRHSGEQTSDLLRLRQHRQSHLLRPLDTHQDGPNRYGRRPDAIVLLSAKTTFSIQPATSFYLI